ncbi:MAG: crossover junction endodeoxyribonuclease RuvC [Elusimicrobia bacterium]|nr:crossover junction endodeoxyribonuclease RuvC [Elusimicrobiota bacterium]MBP9699517.1 crossover junction endodeoxyribonuclease RuvC [Elusimicrobiota bacterium]
MKVLGIDPGLGTVGWAVLEVHGRETYRVWGYGAIETPRARPLAERVLFLARALKEIVSREQPVVAAIEDLFIAKNSRTAASVGHGRGAILLTLAELGLPIHEYNPRQVKVALTGYGAADKSQMQTMVQRLLRLKEIPKPDDAADALAIALCHINSSSYETGVRG